MPSTLTPTVPYGVVDSLFSATVGTWNSMTRAGLDYWSGALARSATPYELSRDLGNWMAAMSDRERPQWAHEHTVLKEWPIARLRDYSTPDADPSMVATILLPPQAGHDSCIVDYSPAQSQIITARDNGCHRVLSFDWIGATQETRDTSIDDYMQVMREAIDLVGGRANLVGDCQGGWLATIFAALHPELVNSLAIAGAPIDFHAGEPLIHDWLQLLTPGGDMTFYRCAVEANDGVLPGKFLLNGFMALQPDQEVDRQLQLLANMHDPAHTERYRRFENWFQWTQSLPGEFYLWVVEHLFAKNELIRGELVVEGRTVDLAAIDCPLFLMAGTTDHITPAPQVWALADVASTHPDKIGRQSSKGGHLGLFMGRDALEKHWSVIFAEMSTLSRSDVSAPAELTDEPTGHGEFVVEIVTEVPVTEPPASEPTTPATRAARKSAPRARKAVAKRAPRKAAPAKAAPAAKRAASAPTSTPAPSTPTAASTTRKTSAPAARSTTTTPAKTTSTPSEKDTPTARRAQAEETTPAPDPAQTTEATPTATTAPAQKDAPATETSAPADSKSAPSARRARAAKATPTAKAASAPATKAKPTTKAASAPATKAKPTTKTASGPATKAAPETKPASAPATKSASAPATKSASAPATKAAPETKPEKPGSQD